MKYFTLRWWEGKVENPMVVNEQYCRYVQSVKKSLPKDLWRLFWNVSLHDAHLRRLHFAQHKLELKLDGGRRDKGKYRLGLQRFRLTYDGVSRMTSLASPKRGLGGPGGYGDLGYDEIEVIADGLFEHRILFSSGIELQVRFSNFTLWYEDDAAS